MCRHLAPSFGVGLVMILSAAHAAAAADSPSEAVHFPIHKIRFAGNHLVDSQRLENSVRRYYGAERRLQDLLDAKQAVSQAYAAEGYRLVAVGLPSHFTPDGQITLTIREIPLGQVRVSGPGRSAEASVRYALPALHSGQALNFTELDQQLALANQNPSRQLALKLQGGEGAADAEIAVQEEASQRLGLSLDNTGSAATGRARAGITYLNSDLWQRGHVLTLGYNTAVEEPGRVKQLALSYQLPLPRLGDNLSIAATYSASNSGRVADVFDISGEGTTYALHYTHALTRAARHTQLLEFGFDARNNRNTVNFFGQDLGVDVNERPASLSYHYRGQWADTRWQSSLSYLQNIETGRKNDNAAYGASRAGARADWHLWRYRLGVQQGLGAWQLAARLEGQYSPNPLISGEQFALGGAHAVRGFEEREASGDRGLLGGLELYSPAIGQHHRALIFADAGRHTRLNPQAGEVAGDDVASAGLGWRSQYGHSLSLSVDWAYVLNGAARGTPTNQSFIHASAAYWF